MAITTLVWLLYQLNYQALGSKVVGSYGAFIYTQKFWVVRFLYEGHTYYLYSRLMQ